MNKTSINTNQFTIIIPTYNEKENINMLIGGILKYLPKSKIVVVDDSPNNDTLKQIQSFLKKKKNIVAISRAKKSGRGSAVLEGMEYALKRFNSDYYIEMDADLSHDPSELITIANACGKGRIVEASRYIKGSRIVNWPIERRLASKISNMLVKLVLRIPFHDNTNGYRAYPKDAVKFILTKKFISKGYMVLSEMAYILMKKKYTFLEIPSTFKNRRSGRSSANIREFLSAFRDLVSIRLTY